MARFRGGRRGGATGPAETGSNWSASTSYAFVPLLPVVHCLIIKLGYWVAAKFHFVKHRAYRAWRGGCLLTARRDPFKGWVDG